MSYRWGKTIAAYQKWKHIFGQQLPIDIPLATENPIGIATIIRDVIWFAHRNNLKGGAWYGHVSVCARDRKLEIVQKSELKQTLALYHTYDIFGVVAMFDADRLIPGSRFYYSGDPVDLDALMLSLGVQYKLQSVSCLVDILAKEPAADAV